MIGSRRRARVIVLVLVALAVATALASAAIGSVRVSPREVLAIVLARVGIGAGDVDPTHDAVLVAIRLPRVVLGASVGAALGASGAAMQGLFRNALVDPGMIGVSSGAALFAVAAIVLGARIAGETVSPALLPAMAFVGALAASAIVPSLARDRGRLSIAALLLAGIAVNALASALTGLLTFTATDAQVRSITFWTLGSLGGATWTTTSAALPFLGLAVLLLPRLARALDLLALGDAEAAHLGLRVTRDKRAVLVLVALGVGASVATTGVVGFVGLVVPHLVRLLVGPGHRVLVPASALAGATLLLFADCVARTVVAPAELPLGVVTAAIGAPFFLALLVRERRRLT